MNKLKILFVTTTLFGVRGTTGTYRLISILAKFHNVLVVTPNNINQEKHIVFIDNSIKIVKIVDRSNKGSLLKIKNLIDTFCPDIVYMFNSPNIINYLYHLSPIFPETKWIADFKTPLLQEGHTRKKIRQKSFLSQFYLDAIFTLSRHSTKTWIPFLMRKTLEYPLGLDLSLFTPKKIVSEHIYCHKFVFIGSLHPYRKLDFLINNFCRIIRDKPDIPFTLDIYGSGSAATPLKRLIRRNSMTDRIHLCGLLEQEKLFDKLKDYDAGIAYVPTQKYNKSPSLKVIEYVAAGLPAFASDTIGHRKQMDNGLSFTLFKNTPASFIETITSSASSGIKTENINNNLKAIHRYDYRSIIKYYIEPHLQALTSG
ncbi:MAG: glycosyltransferase family 4 protein [Desulfocapsa sp.]|nr:glycosyltransferase family 4 protein [Desulfocapsa sp.]